MLPSSFRPNRFAACSALSNWKDVRVADRDGTYQITKNPHFGQVLDWMKTLRTSGIAFNTDDWSADWQPAFADGTIAGCLIASWMTDFLPKFAPQQGGRWGITSWPEFDRRGSNNGGSVISNNGGGVIGDNGGPTAQTTSSNGPSRPERTRSRAACTAGWQRST